jgi:hypothetical protein
MPGDNSHEETRVPSSGASSSAPFWGTAYTPAAPTVSIAASYRPIVERYWTRPNRRCTLKR